MNSFEIAAVGFTNDQAQLRLLAHNLVNVATPGYKRQIAAAGFPQLMGQLGGAAELSQAPMQVSLDLKPGKLSPSANPLDVALAPRHFLVVEREDGQALLASSGALQVDGQGVLRHASGLKVMGQGGAIQLPASGSTPTVDGQGRIQLDGKVLDQLRQVQLAEGTPTTAVGSALLEVAPSRWQSPDPTAELRSGQVEASNVMASQEMVNLLGVTRHAETMARVMQLSDDMLEKAIRRFGE